MDDELKSVLGQILTVVESTRNDVAILKTDVAALQVGQDALRADVTALQVGQDALRDDLEQLRHVTSANYLKLSGKVDLVANMLADHIADYHGPGDRKRA